jgi:transcriptional regulator with XRE-family HTH domain
LRLAREAKGFSARQVADATKLSVRAIEALEANRLTALPGGIYRRSIVKSVANEVGLDSAQLLREFTERDPAALPEPERVQALAAASPRASSWRRVLAIAGAILPLAAGAGYFVWGGSAATPPASTARPAVAPDEWRPEIVPAGGFLEPPPPARRAVMVTLTISSRCQLRINADGREVLGRTVEAGETMAVELGDELILSGDNAAAVQFSINGQAGRMLGEPGEPLAVRIGRDDYETYLIRH